MSDPVDSAEQRRLARQAWPVVAVPIGVDTGNLVSSTTPEERIAMMWPLALEAYRLAGIPIPAYDRAHTPCRWVRRDDVGRSE